MSELLTNLPLLLIYIIPGYVTIEVKNYILPSNKKDNFKQFLSSLFISYILIIIADFSRYVWHYLFYPDSSFSRLSLTSSKTVILLIILGIIVGYLFARLLESSWFLVILTKLKFDPSTHATVWNQVFSKSSKSNTSPYLRVYLGKENLIYEGYLKYHTCNPSEQIRELYLVGYRSYDYDGQLLEDNYGQYDIGALINYSQISRLEVLAL